MDQLKKRHDGALIWIGLSSVNNTIGSELLRGLERLLVACEGLPEPRALIIYGTGRKFFSPGLNLHEVSQFDRAEMSSFMQAFSRVYLQLFSFPKPVLAMLNGDALAGGFLLASCCDFRFGHRRIKVGLTKLSRSLVMPFVSVKILECLIGTETAQEITSRGQSLSAERAFQMGWLDGIFDEEHLPVSVREKALECVRHIDDVPDLRKYDGRKALAEQIYNDERQHLDVFLDHWFSKEAQQQMEEMIGALNNRRGQDSSKTDDERKGVEKS